MTFQTRMQAVADRLLTAYGETIVFSRVTEGSYVPASGTVGTGTTISYSVLGSLSNYTDNDVDGNLVQLGDIRAIIQVPASYTPLVGDVATVNSKTYRVMSVLRYRAQGGDIAYIVQLRI